MIFIVIISQHSCSNRNNIVVSASGGAQGGKNKLGVSIKVGGKEYDDIAGPNFSAVANTSNSELSSDEKSSEAGAEAESDRNADQESESEVASKIQEIEDSKNRVILDDIQDQNDKKNEEAKLKKQLDKTKEKEKKEIKKDDDKIAQNEKRKQLKRKNDSNDDKKPKANKRSTENAPASSGNNSNIKHGDNAGNANSSNAVKGAAGDVDNGREGVGRGIGNGTGNGVGSGSGNGVGNETRDGANSQAILEETIGNIQTLIMQHWYLPQAANKSIVVIIELTLNDSGEIVAYKLLNNQRSKEYQLVANSVLRTLNDPKVKKLPIQHYNQQNKKSLDKVILKFCPKDLDD